MGYIIPSPPAAKMTLKRAKRGAKICIWEAAASCVRISSLATLLSWVISKAPQTIPQVPLKHSCTLPTCTHGKHCGRQQSRTELLSAHCYMLTPLPHSGDERDVSFCFPCGRSQSLPPGNSKDQLSTVWPTCFLGVKPQSHSGQAQESTALESK